MRVYYELKVESPYRWKQVKGPIMFYLSEIPVHPHDVEYLGDKAPKHPVGFRVLLEEAKARRIDEMITKSGLAGIETAETSISLAEDSKEQEVQEDLAKRHRGDPTDYSQYPASQRAADKVAWKNREAIRRAKVAEVEAKQKALDDAREAIRAAKEEEKTKKLAAKAMEIALAEEALAAEPKKKAPKKKKVSKKVTSRASKKA